MSELSFVIAISITSSPNLPFISMFLLLFKSWTYIIFEKPPINKSSKGESHNLHASLSAELAES